MNLFRNSKYEIEVAGPGALLVACYDHLLCRKLNRILGTYGDYTHQEGEEGLFKLRSLANLSKFLKTPPFEGLSPNVVLELKKVLKV